VHCDGRDCPADLVGSPGTVWRPRIQHSLQDGTHVQTAIQHHSVGGNADNKGSCVVAVLLSLHRDQTCDQGAEEKIIEPSTGGDVLKAVSQCDRYTS